MKIIFITGQTATGKTKLALEFAQKYNGELINCDSRQIYKHLDIITGKDLTDHKFHLNHKLNHFDIGYFQIAPLLNCSIAQLLENNRGPKAHQPLAETIEQSNNGFKLWLYDIVDPKQYFSSFDYAKCALYVIRNLLKNGKTPIIIGGTYLYFYHLLYNVETENIPPNWKLRQELEKKTISELQEIFKDLAPKIFNNLNHSEINNPQRLIRKIEIVTSCRDGACPVSTLKFQLYPFFQNHEIEFIGLRFGSKETLRENIKKRVVQRLNTGAIEEVEKLKSMGYNEKDPGLQTIGYKQILMYLNHKISKEEVIEQWATAEFQYAKRQYTFMKKDKHIVWQEI